MKTPTLTSFLILLLLLPALRAETPNESEFKTARAARAKALADAAAPINRRYMETLNLLFRKATQAAELDLANAIRTEMQAVGGTAAVAAAGQSVTPPKALDSAGSVPTRTDLKKLIEKTRWLRVGPGGDGHMDFYSGGEIRQQGFSNKMKGATYALEAPDVLKFVLKKEDKNGKNDVLYYRVDVNAMTASLIPDRSPGGAQFSLKYQGPAPKK